MTKEADIQIACNYLLNQLSKIYFFRHYHIANEGKRSLAYKVKLKKMGFRSGAPDLVIEYPYGKILYVELDSTVYYNPSQIASSENLRSSIFSALKLYDDNVEMNKFGG